jgi:arylsulfatase A-like enzyme
MKTPNLLFLYTDEQRFNTLAAYGNNAILMPNLNKLLDQSNVFAQAYVTQPVCTPSRSSLLTGCYPHSNGCVANNIALRPETACLPEMLTPGKWTCAHHGKWHLGDEIFSQHGFTEWRGTEDTYQDHYFPGRPQMARSSYHRYLVENGIEPEENGITKMIGIRFFRNQLMNMPEQFSRPAFLAKEASRFIGENKGRPWTLYVNFLEPHMPFHSCRDSQYDPSSMPIPDNYNAVLGEGALHKERIYARKLYENGYGGQRLRSEEDWRELTARYWGLCSLVDTHIGKILGALEESGQLDNTIIVFTSDHGDLMASHRLLGKGFMYEESVRVPFSIRLPGQKEGRIIEGPVNQIDVVPTLLDLLGEEAPDVCQGESLRPLLEGRGDCAEKPVFIEWNSDKDPAKPLGKFEAAYAREVGDEEAVKASLCSNIRTVVRPDGLKFNWSSAGEHQLFDLANDPGERMNLANDSAMRGKINECIGMIQQWQEKTRDTVAMS